MIYTVSQEIEGLIFDFDGTVVDSMPAHYLSWRAAFSEFGAEFTERFCYDYAGLSLTAVVETYNREMGTTLAPAEVVALKNKKHLSYNDHIHPIPEVMDLIDRYFGKLPMAVATGGMREVTAPLITALGLIDYFVTVVYSDDVKRSKPHPDAFLQAARAMGIAPDRCEVFEDGEAGLEAARRAGMKATDIRPWLE